MFEDLGKLINAIQRDYDRICSKWSQTPSLQFNLKKNQVIDVRENSKILDSIWTYRSLINDELIHIMFAINLIEYEKSSVTCRVKAQNSIEFKLENYITHHESGTIPLKKCMNDLLGSRIVIDDEFTYADVKKYMDTNFPQYKCIDSSKLSYSATHVYFENGNTFFPCTKWESENRGGVESD
jgi:hypothetical protein